jgi:stage II sporulation protein D
MLRTRPALRILMPFARSRAPIRPAALVAILGLLAIAALIAASRPAGALAAHPWPSRGAVPSPAPTPTPTPPPTPAVTPTPSGPTPIGAATTFYGRGYGHGVGMSQYGARGRAAAGATAADILAHYYRGTTLGSIDVLTPIRVRVLSGFKATSSSPLVVVGRRDTWRIDGVDATFPEDARIELRPTAVSTPTGTRYTWKGRVVAASGTVLREAVITTFRVRGATVSTVFQVASRTSSYDTYRGTLRVGLPTTSNATTVTNELRLERYLRGVVPAEMPSTWPSEALRAQSIAARSYAARRLRPGVSYFDITDDVSSQVYLGVVAEKAATTAAVDATAGVVLRSGSAIANALFHSTGGGATEHNENVFVSEGGAKVAGPVSYLRGSSDRGPDGTPFDATSPYATWKTASYTRAQLSGWFASDSRTNVGTLRALDLRVRGVSGRLIRVTLIGSLGSKTVSGNVFRSIFNAQRPPGDPMMRSTLFDTKPVP